MRTYILAILAFVTTTLFGQTHQMNLDGYIFEIVTQKAPTCFGEDFKTYKLFYVHGGKRSLIQLPIKEVNGIGLRMDDVTVDVPTGVTHTKLLTVSYSTWKTKPQKRELLFLNGKWM